MKKVFSIISLCFFFLSLHAQKENPVSIFFKDEFFSLIEDEVQHVKYMMINKSQVDYIFESKPDSVSIILPTPKRKAIIDLERIDLFTDSASIYTSSGKSHKPTCLVYYGKVRGDDGGFASVVIDKDVFYSHIMGDGQGWIFSSVDGLLYGTWNQENYKDTTNFKCVMLDREGSVITNEVNKKVGTPVDKLITMYIEADYDMYTKLGSAKKVISVIENVFAQTFILYKNEKINIKINRLKIWDTPSGYTYNSYEMLLSFGYQMRKQPLTETFGKLVSLEGSFGVAWLNSLCDDPFYRTSYSGLTENTLPYPNYSWNSHVMTHEIGHNIGSPHTQSCSWNGNNTALDGCWFIEPTGPVPCKTPEITPYTKGTIMSYCHLNLNVGVDYKWGFGLQPGNLIRQKVSFANCLEKYLPESKECPGKDSSYTKINIKISANKFFEDFYYSIKQNNKIVLEYNSNQKRLTQDTSVCILKDSCFTLTIILMAKPPFVNKINFSIHHDSSVIYEISNVYRTNDSIKLCLNNQTVKKINQNLLPLSKDNIIYNDWMNDEMQIDRWNMFLNFNDMLFKDLFSEWKLYNLNGVLVGFGNSINDLNDKQRKLATGIYILLGNNKYYKKIFISNNTIK